MTTTTDLESAPPQPPPDRTAQQSLLPPSEIEIRLSAHFDGVAGLVRWEVECLDGPELVRRDLFFGWHAFDFPGTDYFGSFRDAVEMARTRVSPF